MKRAIILLAIFFLAISGVYGAAYPGGFFRDSIDMRGHEITNASNLATTSDVSGVVSQLSQSLSDDENNTAQGFSDAHNYTDLVGSEKASVEDVSDLQNYTSGLPGTINDITGNVSDLQGDMSGVLAGTFQVVETVIIPGESAGNHTIFAITATDFLDKVYFMHTDDGDLAISDITSEFRGEGHSSGVVTDGLINNNNGTDTTGGFMMVSWYTRYMLFSA